MKNILKLFMLLFCFDAVAASPNNAFSGMPDYLKGVAKAWTGIFSEFGPSAEISAYINDLQNNNVAEYLDIISILGFNNTAMALLEINQHVGQSFSVLDSPLVARRNECTQNLEKCGYGRRMVVIDGQVFGSFSDYSGGNNGDYKTKNTGFIINAKTYFADGWLFGVGYNRTMTDTNDTKIYSDATGNSITLFTQYLAKSGMFLNLGLNAGHTSWNIDKSIGTVINDGTYDTDFYAGQVNLGIRMLRGRISVTPVIALRYLLVSADKYIDGAAQEFDDWWYNTMTTSAGLDLAFDFIGADYVIRPNLHLGGGYDVISTGAENMKVQLVDSQYYSIPVESPDRAILNAGVGLDFFNEYFTAGLNYILNMRENYINNTIVAKIKIAF